MVVEAGRAYFDTNTSDHHHFFLVDKGILQDIDVAAMPMDALPQPPAGSKIERVDVVIRCRKDT